MKKITVIGATGMVGIPVTRELVKAGYEVTALVRDTDKARLILPKEVKLVKGDLNDKTSIVDALKNADGLYINISTRPNDKESGFNPEREGLDNILTAARETNVKQIAYLSSFLARNYRKEWWVMLAKKESITKVKEAGMPFTIFYPANFMENFKHGMVQGRKITIIGKPKNKSWWIAGADFGKQVAASFQTPLSLNKEYPVQGPEPLDMIEAANIYANNFSKEKLTVGSMPMGLFKFLAIFITQLKFVTKLMEVMLENKETFESQVTWDELGKPDITIEKFARQ
jgi:uncharacterized protein YbjT (DUF2867 family)